MRLRRIELIPTLMRDVAAIVVLIVILGAFYYSDRVEAAIRSAIARLRSRQK